MRRTQKLSSDSCGCVMGSYFLAAGVTIASAWYAWHWHIYGLTFRAVGLRVTIAAFLASAAGKLFGLALFRFRTRNR